MKSKKWTCSGWTHTRIYALERSSFCMKTGPSQCSAARRARIRRGKVRSKCMTSTSAMGVTVMLSLLWVKLYISRVRLPS